MMRAMMGSKSVASRWFFAFVMLPFLGCASTAQVPGGSTAAAVADQPALRSGMLVSAAWLQDHLQDPGVVVLQVGSDRAEYDAGHIPGARFLPLGAILVPELNGIRNEMPEVAQLDSVFGSLGVSPSARVVLYGAPLAAARAFFTLDYLGAGDRAALLDGGLAGWLAEGRAVSQESASSAPVALRTAPDLERLVSADWVNDRLGAAGITLLDARPAADFRGEASSGLPREGHIPGAVNIFWQELIESTDRPVLKDVATLRQMFSEVGIQPGDTVVSYCRTGMQASFSYFVARYLGYDARLYDGSFMEWSQRPELPVETAAR